MLFCSADEPNAALSAAVVFLYKEYEPLAVLLFPVVLFANVDFPVATLLAPVVFAFKAYAPIAIVLE